MRGGGRWIVLAMSIVGLGLVATTRDIDARPPPPVVGGLWPTDPGYSLNPVDDTNPAFQEGVSESRPGPVAAGGMVASGSIMAADNFSDPATGILPQASAQPNRWRIGYLDGEYQIASLAPGLDMSESVLAGGSYADVSIAVDARVIQGPASNPDETVRIYCRRQTLGGGFTGYRFQYSPLLNLFGLFRGDGDGGVSLTGVQSIDAPPIAWQTHRLALTCTGSTIAASIDGRQVASVQDGSYREGSVALGVGNFTRMDPGGIVGPGAAYPGTYDARFGRLVLSRP